MTITLALLEMPGRNIGVLGADILELLSNYSDFFFFVIDDFSAFTRLFLALMPSSTSLLPPIICLFINSFVFSSLSGLKASSVFP